MSRELEVSRSDALALTAEIVRAHVANNQINAADLPGLIQSIFDKLAALAVGEPEPAPVALVPAVPIRRSVNDDYIVCLEDGRRLKVLKRHLMSAYGMTPEQYRARWGLPPDYPMVAPSYAVRRQELAKASGLGRKRPAPTPEAPAPAPAPKKTRARRTPKAA